MCGKSRPEIRWLKLHSPGNTIHQLSIYNETIGDTDLVNLRIDDQIKS